jgi:hypothetical protein
MAKIENLERLVATLRGKAARANKDKDASVIVGYTALYALYVHENLEVRHPVGQAKYLEQPAREFGKEIGRIVRESLAQGKTLAQGLVLGGLRLQRESQKIVPVDTGDLRASAFTRLEQ